MGPYYEFDRSQPPLGKIINSAYGALSSQCAFIAALFVSHILPSRFLSTQVYGGQAFEETKGDVIPTTLSDVQIFDLDKQKWFQPIQCDDKTRQHPRQWHTASFLPQRQLLVVFGGEHMNPKTGRVTTPDKNNLIVLDTEILLWYPVSFFVSLC